jgi:hypothetical protein
MFLSFLDYGQTKVLSRDAMNRYIKRLAQHFHLNPARFSTRSLRVGAATTMSAEGKSKADIDTTVGWSQRGNTSLRYVRSTPNMEGSNQLAMRDLAVMQAATTAIPVFTRRR